MGWNGLDLVNDFATEAGDTSPAFKTKILRFINDGIKDIATSHAWPFLREKGKVQLEASEDTHSIVLAKPAAPTIALAAGGSLTVTVVYSALVTFYESQSGVESIAGNVSGSVLTNASNLSFDLTAIPVSTNPLVTSRKIYISKGGGAYQYHSEIADNTTLTQTISTNATSSHTPPEEDSIHKIDGSFFIEGQRVLEETSLQNLIYQTAASSSTGTPSRFAIVNEKEIKTYPAPSSDTIASFYYFKLPAKIFGTLASIPQIPSWLYDDLKNYVKWRSYDFRDRAGQESKKLNYDSGLRLSISRRGKANKGPERVRSVTPDSDGYVN